MVAWGLTGLIAGLLSNRILTGESKTAMMIYGAISAFIIHGAITDIWTIFFVNEHPTLGTVLTIYGAAIVPNAILAAATAVFLFILGKPMVKKIERVKMKYGLEEVV